MGRRKHYSKNYGKNYSTAIFLGTLALLSLLIILQVLGYFRFIGL